MDGGKVIASGTYGCLFNPAIPCINKTIRPPNTVSKLMTEKNAKNEMKEIKSIVTRVKKIPHNDDYFILNKISICVPEKLKKEDLIDYKKKCLAMNNLKISEDIVNTPYILNRLRILQLPDGGQDVSRYFSQHNLEPALYVKINDALLGLLENGIVPLAAVDVLHYDVKASNIVYSEKENKARLIDWGLSMIYNRPQIPFDLGNYPISFNQPYTSLVFNPNIEKIFNIFRKNVELANKPIDVLIDLLQHTISSIVFKDDESIISNIGAKGHLPYIESYLKKITSIKGVHRDFVASIKYSASVTIGHIISKHLANVFIHFSMMNGKLGKFRKEEFFYNVFCHNCDVFGFISIYMDFAINSNFPMPVRHRAYKIINKYIFNDKYTTMRYDMSELITDCRSMNKMFLPEVKPKPKLVIVEQPRSLNTFTLSLSKRCPKGTRRNKKTGKCHKVKKAVVPRVTNKTRKKRCPNGTRRNKKTGNCEPKK